VAAVTSNVERRLFGDCLIANWKQAGLLFPSVATGILRTIKRTMIQKKLGAMPKIDLENFDRNYTDLWRCDHESLGRDPPRRGSSL